MNSRDDAARRSKVVRNAILLALFAAAVYGTFIFVQYQRSRGTM
jgi:hypothetical protein